MARQIAHKYSRDLPLEGFRRGEIDPLVLDSRHHGHVDLLDVLVECERSTVHESLSVLRSRTRGKLESGNARSRCRETERGREGSTERCQEVFPFRLGHDVLGLAVGRAASESMSATFSINPKLARTL